jgi:Leucine-rich repeat (LRR) protein
VGEGRTGLDVTPSSPGLVADLLSKDGTVVEVGKSTIDIRAIDSGTYFLRVYDPTNSATGDVPFEIEVDAPIQGYTHPTNDRDTIHGGDGDDLLVGNQALDRIWGDSGRDDFIAETLELRDFEGFAGETVRPSLSSERSNIPPEGPPVDAPIAITDPGLRVAIAEALGIPVTQSYIEGQFLIHVDDASQRTDLSLAEGANFRERILASDLGELAVLDAAGRDIEDLSGLKYAVNLTTLNLAGNNIDNGEFDKLLPGTQSNGETRGFPIGLGNLENLSLDFNPVTDLLPLTFFTDLERLSIDGTTVKTIMDEVPSLKWPEVGGVERSLEFLSLDYVGPHGLTTAGIVQSGKVYIAEDGPVRFTSDLEGSGGIVINGVVVYETNSAGTPITSDDIVLERGWHNVLLVGAGATLFYDTDYGPLQAVPESALLPFANSGEPIFDLSNLLVDDQPDDAWMGQSDLRFLSLRNNVIEDVRPLVHLDNLEVARLDNNRIRNIEDLVGERLIDNRDSGFTAAGQWDENLSPTDAAFEDYYVFRNGTDASTPATWTFNNLDSGVYQVLMTYVESDFNSEVTKLPSTPTILILRNLLLVMTAMTMMPSSTAPHIQFLSSMARHR